MGGVDWSSIVTPFDPAHVTPAGYDFTLDEVQGFGWLTPYIWQDAKELPLYETRRSFESDGKQMYMLREGIYMVKFAEIVKIPASVIGIMHPRSTLTRCGVALETAVWDPGYEGISHCLLHVLNPAGVYIEHGSRVGHMTLHNAHSGSGLLYTGQYQKEGITT